MGPHCKWCPAMSSCPAQGGIVRAMVHDSYAPERVAEAMLACSPADAGIAWQRLEQAKRLIDLIERALKTRCSSEGSLPLPDGGVVRIATTPRKLGGADAAALGVAPGPYVAFSVIDSGVGMSPDVLAKATEPY